MCNLLGGGGQSWRAFFGRHGVILCWRSWKPFLVQPVVRGVGCCLKERDVLGKKSGWIGGAVKHAIVVFTNQKTGWCRWLARRRVGFYALCSSARLAPRVVLWLYGFPLESEGKPPFAAGVKARCQRAVGLIWSDHVSDVCVCEPSPSQFLARNSLIGQRTCGGIW